MSSNFEIAISISLIVLTSMAFGVTVDGSESQDDLFELSIEELLEVPIVVSSSRRSQKIIESSVPISLITADDIHYGGYTNIPEALKYTSGIDVLRINRNMYAVGVRGLHDGFSDRTLFLINGRVSESPLFGGPEFLREAIFMEDIDHIEIVRGPGGAAWGANAFNGVINVITKKPEDIQGTLLSTQWNEFGDNYHHLRWADVNDDLSWRISAGYEKQESSSEAMNEETFIEGLSSSEFMSNDHFRNLKFDSELFKKIDEDTELSFGSSYSYNQLGDFGFLSYYPMDTGFQSTLRNYLKLNRDFEDGSSGYFQWYGNILNEDRPTVGKYKVYENTFEGQYNFSLWENHKTTLGSSVKFTFYDQDPKRVEDITFNDSSFTDERFGIYLIDTWQMDDDTVFESQFRSDYYSKTNWDWSARLSLVKNLDRSKNEVFRLSAAKSYRTPLNNLTYSTSTRLLIAPSTYAVNVFSNPKIDNEQIWSLETGYGVNLTKKIRYQVNGYFQKYDDLIGYEKTLPFAPSPIQYFTPDNNHEAYAYGVENELTYKSEKYDITAWADICNFNVTTPKKGVNAAPDIRGFNPARFKGGITLRAFLEDGYVFNANYKYKTKTSGENAQGYDVPHINQLDLAISKDFKAGKATGEFMIGIQDVFNETEVEIHNIGVIYYAHETPGRMIFARMQLNY